MESFNHALDQYRSLLTLEGRGELRLPNENFDTGIKTQPGAYHLVDRTYSLLLEKLEGKPVPSDLRDDILSFYSNLDAPFDTKTDPEAWKKVLARIEALKSAP
jgi:hypothetical protein